MNILEQLKLSWNIDLILFDEHGEVDRRNSQRTHNIITNTGRQFMAEVITAATFGSGTFTRHDDSVVRYIGFGIGGTRQADPSAVIAPLADAYPAGYGGTNVQTDTDPTVARLERPVLVSSGPDVWMKEISVPGTFPTAMETTFIATFTQLEINIGAFTAVPLSEIALYKSSADPSLPNGGAGAYPGATGHTIAYDTFNSFQKTGIFNLQVRWTWRLGT